MPGAAVTVEVKAPSNAHIALTNAKGESSPMYEIMLGGWENTASVIRYDRKQPDKVRHRLPQLSLSLCLPQSKEKIETRSLSENCSKEKERF